MGFDEYPVTLDAVYLAAQAMMENKKPAVEPTQDRVMLTEEQVKTRQLLDKPAESDVSKKSSA